MRRAGSVTHLLLVVALINGLRGQGRHHQHHTERGGWSSDDNTMLVLAKCNAHGGRHARAHNHTKQNLSHSHGERRWGGRGGRDGLLSLWGDGKALLQKIKVKNFCRQTFPKSLPLCFTSLGRGSVHLEVSYSQSRSIKCAEVSARRGEGRCAAAVVHSRAVLHWSRVQASQVVQLLPTRWPAPFTRLPLRKKKTLSYSLVTYIRPWAFLIGSLKRMLTIPADGHAQFRVHTLTPSCWPRPRASTLLAHSVCVQSQLTRGWLGSARGDL